MNDERTSIPAKSAVAIKEEKILAFWKEKNIFEKTLKKKSPQGEFVFYDGPPFATGLPHYGHILSSAIKDAVPRYKTMRGFHVPRRWGWDCHGLPIENIVEKDLGISGKKEIEALGVEKFNTRAKEKVLEYVGDWKQTVDRMGRWVDFDGSYKTMDNSYIESVWWALSELNKQGLVYEGEKVLPYCPRCETPIAASEIAMDSSYKDVTEEAVTVKFKVTNPERIGLTGDVYLLAWTTTPWTLPGNVALAVGEDIKYQVARIKFLTGGLSRIGDEGDRKDLTQSYEYHIYASSRENELWKGDRKKILQKGSYHWEEIKKEIVGKDLIGLRYEPLFAVHALQSEKSYKVYDGSGFVTTEEGTGIVHTAVMYGEDDFALGVREGLPKVQLLNQNGTYNDKAPEFLRGKYIKDAEKDIKRDLESRGLLFEKKNNTHSYPHCFRCETPIYYNALDAWFVRISQVKEKLIALNEKINWIPAHLKEGRFKKSMEGAPDWNISRSRYWASPLPIWKCAACNAFEFVDSLKTLKKKTQSSGNTYLLMRHGEAENNTLNVLSGELENRHHLTEQGKAQVREAGVQFKGKTVDLIVSSPLLRTKETAEIFAEVTGYPKEKIVFDIRLREVIFGSFEGKSPSEYRSEFPRETGFTRAPKGGETIAEQKKRTTSLLYELEAKYAGKTILFISHMDPLLALSAGAQGLGRDEISSRTPEENTLKNAEVHELSFVPLPVNGEFELDLHRPYIDRVALSCACGGVMRRIPEVFDCWFESGSMPFAASHFPFEKKDWFKNHFPGDFVAEYIAQTRTWFYYMHAVAGMLFGSVPFRNVVTTGTILAEDGQKMSKSKGNFPNPALIFDRYGVDALRFYLLGSQVMKSEDLNFSEKGVKDVANKVASRAENVLAFYELYPAKEAMKDGEAPASSHVLDRWIVAKLSALVGDVSSAMDAYELDRAVRPIATFIDDLSTWYVRRSRGRFKREEKGGARETLRYALVELSKLCAPFMPFLAEDIYIRAGGRGESVHLAEWPACADRSTSSFLRQFFGVSDGASVLSDMETVREIVSRALLARAKAGIKVRQPLETLAVKREEARIQAQAELLELIKDEINVKNVVFGAPIQEEMELDTRISEALKKEGQFREVVRAVQDLRKENNFTPDTLAVLSVATDDAGIVFIKEHEAALKEATTLSAIECTDSAVGEKIIIDEFSFVLSLTP
ncbi:MAG: hypothetical protein A3G11_00490 [Candidatus Lloydbacteria bacterium RIFCSPLOWO2_12_FULL_51_9]|uniref:isoleucine--tRNA ligase n=3 Tax=Candidatus Lloydiibacteriota TaxID=1817910 RepID=A0A1G2DT74_9BACT|nr:MAG: hypothetical protein A3G11_00490 [Candidatus Lloydbacteria bacterium RIFCSPLOWO2_12_FULL_51_9]